MRHCEAACASPSGSLNGLDRSCAVVSVTSPTDPVGVSGGLFSAVVNTNASVHISAPEGNRRTAFATYSVFATRPVATTPTRAAVDQPLSKAGASDVPLRGQTSHRASTWPWSGTLNWAVVRPVVPTSSWGGTGTVLPSADQAK